MIFLVNINQFWKWQRTPLCCFSSPCLSLNRELSHGGKTYWCLQLKTSFCHRYCWHFCHEKSQCFRFSWERGSYLKWYINKEDVVLKFHLWIFRLFLNHQWKLPLKFLLRYNERNVDNIHKNLGTYFIKRRLSFSKNNCDELWRVTVDYIIIFALFSSRVFVCFCSWSL